MTYNLNITQKSKMQRIGKIMFPHEDCQGISAIKRNCQSNADDRDKYHSDKNQHKKKDEFQEGRETSKLINYRTHKWIY